MELEDWGIPLWIGRIAGSDTVSCTEYIHTEWSYYCAESATGHDDNVSDPTNELAVYYVLPRGF